MNVWELALLIFALTYLMVNTVYLGILVKLMSKMNGVMTRIARYMEKLMDKSEKDLDELFNED